MQTNSEVEKYISSNGPFSSWTMFIQINSVAFNASATMTVQSVQFVPLSLRVRMDGTHAIAWWDFSFDFLEDN
jgi:hypothetical protein